MPIVVNIIILIVIGIAALAFLPRFFLKKNEREKAQADFEAYLKHLGSLNKQYIPHQRQLQENLNLINYWLKTGRDPYDEESVEEMKVMEDRYQRKLLTPQEAKEFEETRRRSLLESAEMDAVDEEAKTMRQNEFSIENLDPSDVNQPSMDFVYATDYGEYIYYCVTPDALEKKIYKNTLYFTTSRPSKIPMVFPHKYEGAQMLSLYKHPAEAVWFLSNWKKIRGAMETGEKEVTSLDDTIADFGL